MADDPQATGAVSVTLDLVTLDDGWCGSLPGAGDVARQTAVAAVAAALQEADAPWLAALRARPLEISLVLADDACVRRLNKDYRQRDVATNVLSFAALDRQVLGQGAQQDLDAPVMLGDVVLARETMEREATEQNKACDDHLAHLVAHGVLHLLGFDHNDDDDAETMETLETAVLMGLGRPDPYAHDGEGRAARTFVAPI